MNIYNLISTNFVFTVLFIGVFSSLSAQGDLLIIPKRVVFEEGKKTEIINLTNVSSDTVKYSISFIQFRMNEKGNLERITEPDHDQFFADTFLRYYPRTVTLAPHESQIVKLQLTKTSSLQPGEYRSHLYFRAELKNNPLGEDLGSIDTTSVSVQLRPVFGMTIPCIIRIGKSSTHVGISKLTFKTEAGAKPQLHVDFYREGNFSSYGDLVVHHTSTNGKITRVAQVKGVGIFTPGTSRKFIMALEEQSGLDFNDGDLNVIYASNANKNHVLATATLSLTALMQARAR